MASIATQTEAQYQRLPQSFRSAMRRMAATVTIVSSSHKGARHGMTATAITSVSMEPPSLLVCVNRDASIHDPLWESGRFCINLLSQGQDEYCHVFSGREQGEARFDSGNWACSGGIPYLVDAQANLFCRVDKRIAYGTHTIFIGLVDHAHFNEETRPLLYLDGALMAGNSHAD